MKFFAPIIGKIFPYGSLMDPVKKEGLFHATVENLKYSNTIYSDPNKLLIALESLGANYDSVVTRDYSFMTLRYPYYNNITAAKTLNNLLQNSNPKSAALKKVNEITFNQIEENKSQLSSYAFSQSIRYMLDLDLNIGSAKSVKNIKIKEVKEGLELLKANHINFELESADNFTICFSKDFVNIDKINYIKPIRQKRNYFFEQRDIDQAFLIYSYFTKGAEEYDIALSSVADVLIGSSECGLAFRRIREEKSAAYFASGSHSYSLIYGVNYIFAGINIDNAKIVVDEIRKIFEELTAGQLSTDIFDTAKSIAKGRFLRAYDNPDTLAKFYIKQFTQRFDETEIPRLESLLKKIDKIKVNDIVDYYKKITNSSKPFLYIIGNTDKLTEKLI